MNYYLIGAFAGLVLFVVIISTMKVHKLFEITEHPNYGVIDTSNTINSEPDTAFSNISHNHSINNEHTCDNMKDYQLDFQYNGDILIYYNAEYAQEYVGVYKPGAKPLLLDIINKHIRDND